MGRIIPLSLVVFLFTGCALPQFDVTALGGRPDSAKVDTVSIPYNPEQPKVVLVVEPFKTESKVLNVSWSETGSVPISDKMAAQLTSALSNVGNFVLYDKRHTKSVKVRKGEKGPYYVRATLTEFNELAEAESEENGVSLGRIGVVAGIAGAVTGKPGLMWGGAGVAAADPSFEQTHASKKGMVAFDVAIIDAKTGRIVRSFDCAGTFRGEAASSGFSVFGISHKKTKVAQSALGQALRAAMNEAVEKTADSLL